MSENDRQARFDATAMRQYGEEIDRERELAAARGEEHAVPYDLGLKADPGAPEVELYSHGVEAFLAFYTNEEFREVGLVQFVSCSRLVLGPPGSDDPDFREHRLFGKGLEWYGAHRVVNSSWIGAGVGLGPHQHYLFAFHDEMFEATAREVVVTKWEIPMRELMQGIAAGEIENSKG